MFIAPKKITPTHLYAGAIAEFENVWSDSLKIIKKIESENKLLPSKVQFSEAVVITQSGTFTSNARTNSDLSVSDAGQDNDFFRELNNRFYLTILGASYWYQEHFALPDLKHEEGYNLLRYQTGQEYKAHYDGGFSDFRSVSPILYLNENYEGGELEFVHFGLKIKPKKGSLYLFPSNYAYSHIAHPVTDGTKYALVTWLHGGKA
jgi:predicted 2-oxoglutarate/Fe(II)-dependent dioxygenase YbiX